MATYGYPSFTRQLMESKRRSRLSGRRPSSRESYRMLADWQEGAQGRVRATAQTREMARMEEQSRASTEAMEARFAEYGAMLESMKNQPPPSFEMPPFSMPPMPTYTPPPYKPPDYSGLLYKIKYPYSTVTPADPPGKYQPAVEPVEPRGVEPTAAAPYSFDTSASAPGVYLDPYGGALSPQAKYQAYLKSLRTPAAGVLSGASGRDV